MVDLDVQNGVTFLQAERTWVGASTSWALRRRRSTTLDEKRSQQLSGGEKTRFPDHKVVTAVGQHDRYCSLAVEVGERTSYGSFAEFQSNALAASIKLDNLDRGMVRCESAT